MKKTGLLAVLVLLVPGCAVFGPRSALEQTAGRLGDIRSGNMTLELTATAAGGARTGFRLDGPFSLPSGASLPAADLAYRQLGPGQDKSLAFVSTGDAAYIRVGSQAYELPPERVASLRGQEDAGNSGPFDRLEITEWITEPKTSAGPRLNGSATEIVRGDLKVATALNNIFDMARDLGKPDLPRLEGEEAERLNRAVQSAKIELLTGRDDHFLRKLSLRVDLAAEAPAELGRQIQDLLGVKFELNLAIDRPNQRVKISPPPNPLPLSQLDRS